MKALIDGDLLSYINAVSANDEEEVIALVRMENQLENILGYLGNPPFQIYLSGGTNFRYEINPEYKANRTQEDPIHRIACHQFLIDNLGAIETDGYEADDALGVEQSEDTVICSIDKDMLMIPGKHYSWPITRKGVVVRDHIEKNVKYEEGIKHFFKQMLIGDKADNIIGVDKIGPVKASKIIDPLDTEKEMYNIVREMYQDDDRFNMNLDCLWIWRQIGVTYNVRILGQTGDGIS